MHPTTKKDEELEKFILDAAKRTQKDVFEFDRDSGYSTGAVLNIALEVAAFSGRRAREKAIEECAQKAFLAVGLVNCSRNMSDDVYDAVSSLKSTT